MKRSNFFLLLLGLCFTLQIVSIPSITAITIIPKGSGVLNDQSLNLQLLYDDPSLRTSGGVTDRWLEKFEPGAAIKQGEDVYLYRGTATYKAYITLYTMYSTDQIFGPGTEPYTAEQWWIHEQVRKYGSETDYSTPFFTNTISDRWYTFKYDYYTIGDFQAYGITGNIPLTAKIEDLTPAELDFGENAKYKFDTKSLTGQITEIKIMDRETVPVGIYQSNLARQKNLTYTLNIFDGVQQKPTSIMPGSVNFASDGHEDAKDEVEKRKMSIDVLPLENRTDYRSVTGVPWQLQSVTNPALGILNQPDERNNSYFELKGVRLRPQVNLLSADIQYDNWDRIVISTIQHSRQLGALDTGKGFYSLFSSGYNPDDLIPRIVGWQVTNLAQLYELQIKAEIFATVKIDPQFADASERTRYRIPGLELGDQYWKAQLTGGSVETTIDVTDEIALFFSQYGWIILLAAIGVVVIGGSYWLLFMSPIAYPLQQKLLGDRRSPRDRSRPY